MAIFYNIINRGGSLRADRSTMSAATSRVNDLVVCDGISHRRRRQWSWENFHFARAGRGICRLVRPF